MSRNVRVVKVGGSLLSLAGLRHALDHWLATQPLGLNVLVAGGGELADVVRRADARFRIGDERAHWLCIDVMSVTARILAAVLQDAVMESSIARLREAIERNVAIPPIVFDCKTFLESEASNNRNALPQDWSVTSDSIAARLAEEIEAHELVLLKSSDPPDDAASQVLVQAGYVDSYFPIAARSLPSIRYLNLRAVESATNSDV